MSRADKRKAANLRAKKNRLRPMDMQAAQEAMARASIREWRKANPARHVYSLLDEMVERSRLYVDLLAHVIERSPAAA